MSFTVNAPAAIKFTATGAGGASFTISGIVMTTGEGGGTVTWDDVQDKPTEFPPEDHSHAIADVTGLQTAIDGKQATLGFTPENTANKGVNGGYAELDSGGKVPLNRLPSTLLVYKGVWNASTNSPALTDNDSSKAGWVYNVGTAGTRFSITWNLGDWLIYNDAGVIEKSDNSDDVVSVNGQQGVVVLTKSDVGLGNVDNTSDANKPVSTAQQTALNAKEGTIAAGTTGQYFRGDKTFQTLDKSAVGLGNVDNTSDATKNAATATLTNKRITKRVGTATSSATPTINTDNVDQFILTAQAVDITSFTTNLSGTPTDGQLLWIVIIGTGARAITWGSSFESSTATLPTTTVSTNRLDVGFVWNTNKWRCIATA
jgi:hypothetical protein